MINSANQYPVSDILDIDKNIKYYIPKYQREYIWGKEEWEYLFNDLYDNDKGYFLGSVICIAKEIADSFGTIELEIVDGQQRLTTLSVLYVSIYKRLLEENRTDDDSITERNNLKYRLIQKRGNANELKLELSSQNNNFEDYKSILNKVRLYNDPNFESPTYVGLRRIYRSYSYFNKRLLEFDYDDLLDFLQKINSSLIVKIEVNTHADAFTLFESLNNRGIPLSAMDLLKNKILSVMEKNHIRNIGEAYTDWLKLIDNLQDNYSIQERFLRQFYNAFRYHPDIKVSGISKVTRSTLIKTYEKLIDKDVEYIFNQLLEKSKIYNIFIEPNINGTDEEIYYGFLDLQYVGAAPAYTLLLYLLSEYEDNDLISNVIGFLIKYFVRRNLTDFPGTRDLDNIFINLIDTCEKNKSNVDLNYIKNYLTKPDRFANDTIFEEKLNGNIYEENTAVTRFILCKIEQAHQTKEIYTDFWKRDKNNKYLWTIEHIFPEGKNIPDDWVKMIGDNDKEKAKELQDLYVHKIGNLTLTGYNSQLSNFSFIKKRDRTDNKDNYIGYKNGLYLNNYLKDGESWTVDKIKDRSKLLVTDALNLFKI
jgi:uncharacterized protein with ParB-like and HNH nuclease domain